MKLEVFFRAGVKGRNFLPLGNLRKSSTKDFSEKENDQSLPRFRV